MKKNLFLLILLTLTQLTLSQSDTESAEKNKEMAIEFMDNGKPNEAILLLEDAKKLDPANKNEYDYEIGYANYVKGDYKKSISIFKRLIKDNYSLVQCYPMLGNSYDAEGNPEKALKTYDEGLAQFPNSGRLHLEKGNVYLNQKKYPEALSFYEAGIKIDPTFPSNYYRAALLYLSSTEEVWGMIYGEIFANIERNSERTSKIGKLIFDTYKSEIQIPNDTTMSISFSKNVTISVDDIKDASAIKLPYGIEIYEPTLMMAVIGQKEISLKTLNTIRTNFINSYFEKKYNEKYPNVLFSYNKKMIDLGFFEAYNYWLLADGDIEEFKTWKDKNKEPWVNFIEWYKTNKMEITSDNKFMRF